MKLYQWTLLCTILLAQLVVSIGQLETQQKMMLEAVGFMLMEDATRVTVCEANPYFPGVLECVTRKPEVMQLPGMRIQPGSPDDPTLTEESEKGA